MGARRRCTAWALAACLLGAALAARAGDDEVAAAQAMLDRGDAAGALEAFRLLAAEPGGKDDARVQAGLGAALLATGDARSALGPLSAASRLRGAPEDRWRHASALVATAVANAATGTAISAEVVPYLRDAILEADAGREAPAPWRARLALVAAQAHWWLGEPERVLERLSAPEAAALSGATDLKARAFYETGRHAEAAAAWAAAGNLRAAAAAWTAAGDVRALAAYRDLAQAAPDDFEGLDEGNRAAVWLARVDEHDAALAALDAQGAARGVLARARGRLMERAGRTKDAAVRYREAAAASEGEAAVAAKADLARVLLQAVDDDPGAAPEAAARYAEVLAAAPGDEESRRGFDWLAQWAAKRGAVEWPDRANLDRAVAWFGLLARTLPEDDVAWAQYGNVLRLAGDARAAVAAFDRAIEANPYDGTTRNDRGIALLAAGDEAGALAAFEAAAEDDPLAVSPRQNAGRLRWLAGDFARARAHHAAALAASRTVGGTPMLHRFLLDRVWRSECVPSAGPPRRTPPGAPERVAPGG